MNKETIILAKEKGFKAKTLSTIWTQDYLLGIKPNFKLNDQCYSNLLSEIQKWLREERGIILQIVFSKTFGYHYRIDRYGVVEKKYFDRYEEALEKGLQEALKLIK
jgi:hypothetical protein